MKNIKGIVKQLIAAGVVFDLQVETGQGVVRIQQWRGNFVKVSNAAYETEAVAPLADWLADAETKIYVARITGSPQYDSTWIEFERFGFDKAALKAAQLAHCLTLAPEAAWDDSTPGALSWAKPEGFEHAHSPSVDYEAYIETIIL